MGEVAGKAGAICVKNTVSPRQVYEQYLPELIKLLSQPGKKAV
ncbi:hypothetical protein U0R11_13375 [Aquirufa sp. 1-SAACH-A3]|uniref:Uncharacterized protein n=1 Tax=Aquirufa salirivi TaxID=3104729 RepID=A0ABW8RZS3_9BACT